jgi:hypothetical protein
MEQNTVCERCKGTDLVKGTLVGGPQVGFRPDGIPKFGTVNEVSEVRGELCMACGHLRWIGDRRWVGKLLGRPPS